MNEKEILANMKKAVAKAEKYDKLDRNFKNLTNKSAVEVLQIIRKHGLRPSIIEHNQKVKVPKFVGGWLDNPSCGYSLSEKIKYLVMSHDGDEYYFCEMMVNDSIMNLEFADKMYRYSQKESIENLLQLINGYEAQEEPKYEVVLFKNEEDRMLLMHLNEHEFEVDWECNNSGFWSQLLTEKEIKAIDERYWPFAVPIEKKEMSE